MTAPVVPGPTKEKRPHDRRRWRRWIWVVLGLVVGLPVAFVVASVVALAVFHMREARPIPAFPSLAEHPDPSLAGTVAYYAGDSRCIRLVAAAGRPSKTLLCLPPWRPDPAKVATEGKEMGPRLRWLADGRLEVTMLFMRVGPESKGKAPAYEPGWQKIIDPATGTVEDVPAAEVPSAAPPETHPRVSPSGQRITWTSNASTGRAKVSLSDAAGTTRTLLSVHGPGEYTYRFGPVFWAPNWRWIAASDDGRILVIDPSDPPVTRVLVHGDAFAITAENLLTPSK